VTPVTPAVTVEALQTALAAEHAALYVYGALGARTSESATPVVFREVTDAYATHRAWRDQLTRRLLDEGAVPAPAAPTYELPAGPPGPAGVLPAARELEARCAETYAYVVAHASGPDRRWAIGALTRSAVRQVAFGGDPGPFPGASDLG
jgi:rubrerythrin